MKASRLGLLVVVAAACGRSPLPAPEFPTVPPGLADHRHGVVTLRESTVTMTGAAANGGVPVLRTTSLTRVLVTGDLPTELHRRRIETTDGCYVTRAQARLAGKGKRSVEVDALANAAPVPADLNQLPKWAESRPAVVELDLPKPAPKDLLDFFVERTCIRSFDMVPPVRFGAPMPTLDSRMTVRADPTFQVRVAASRGGDAVGGLQPKTEDGVQLWTMRERDLPAYPDDEFAVDAQHVGPWAQVIVGTVLTSAGEKSYADGWSTIAARVRDAAAPASPVGTPDGDLVKSGSATSRLKKLRERMAPKVSRAPFAPARRYADIPPGAATPFETAAAIVAASKDAPDGGHIALATLAEGPLLVDAVPSLYPFRAVLVASRANGGWQFDDPTCVSCSPGHLPSDLAGGRALIVTDEGYEIVEVPFGATETSRRSMQFAWTMAGNELTGSVLADFEGGDARNLSRLLDADAQRGPEGMSALRTALFGAITGLDVTAVGEASSPTARPFEMRFQVAAKTDAGGGPVKLPVYRVAGPWVPWLTPIIEPRDIVLPGPLRGETSVTIQLPRNYSMARIPDITMRKTVGEYQLHVEHRDDVVTITRRIGLFTHHVPKERYGELRELVLAAADGDAQVIELNPSR